MISAGVGQNGGLATGVVATLDDGVEVVVLAEQRCLVPTLTLAAIWGRSESELLGTTASRTDITLTGQLAAPFLLHFGNFFIGAGPRLRVDILARTQPEDGEFTNATRHTSISLFTVIGGWL